MSEDVTLGEVARLLHRIEARLEQVTGDHETRLRRIERWVYAVPPTLLLSIASVVAAYFQG